MISLILYTYYKILIPLSILSMTTFLIGSYFIIRSVFKKSFPRVVLTPEIKIEPKFIPQDLTAITGENSISAQLHLARAYLETGKKQLAQAILEFVVENGDIEHQKEAQLLLNKI